MLAASRLKGALNEMPQSGGRDSSATFAQSVPMAVLTLVFAPFRLQPCSVMLGWKGARTSLVLEEEAGG